MPSASRLFSHPSLGFSFEIPDHWTIASWQDKTRLEAYAGAMQTSPDDLPSAGDYRNVLIAQEILEHEYDRIRCHIELKVWKDTPFKLPSRAKKFPCGQLLFKARLGTYGRGGLHAAGQLELADGLVLHLTVTTDEPAATTELEAVLATGLVLNQTPK
jgi:hypothetical protein